MASKETIDTRWEDPDFDDEGNVDVEWYPVPKGLHEAWDELQAEHAAHAAARETEPVEKSIRARKPVNSFGHRDNLTPGMTLNLRKGDINDRDPIVAVLPGGAFGWNGDEYPNGNQLLKAITGKHRHRLTVRRYFGLGGERSDGIVEGLRKALMNRAIVVKEPHGVYISGRLSGIVAEGYLSSPHTARLSLTEARKLLHDLTGGDNATD